MRQIGTLVALAGQREALLTKWRAPVDALKRIKAETTAELDALLPAMLDRAFKEEL